jgi:hypothetical protein
MAKKCLGDEVKCLREDFLPEDQQDYLARLDHEVPWIHDFYQTGAEGTYYADISDIFCLQELIVLCEETFECQVREAMVRKFQGTNTTTCRQDDDHIILYSFGETRDVTLENPIRPEEDEPVTFTLNSGDGLYMPPDPDGNPKLYSFPAIESSLIPKKGAKVKINIVVIFKTTKPYTRYYHDLPLIDFSKSYTTTSYDDDFHTSMGNMGMDMGFPMFNGTMPQSGVLATFRDGNTITRTIDATSEYGKQILKQVSAQLKAQGIDVDEFFNDDD